MKTLKDLERFEDLKHQNHFIVSSAVLKQEAIKWIKEIAGIMYDDGLHYSSTWIKHFFNLTEEELK